MFVPTGSCPVTLETHSDATLQGNTGECSEDRVDKEQVLLPRSVVEQMKISGLWEALVSMRTSRRGLQMVLTQDNMTQKRLALVVEGAVDVVDGRPFVIKIANWSKITNDATKEDGYGAVLRTSNGGGQSFERAYKCNTAVKNPRVKRRNNRAALRRCKGRGLENGNALDQAGPI